MAIVRRQIASRTKGSLAEREDWWYLCYDTDADKFYVEHEWDHAKPYKLGEGSERGTTQYAVEDWLERRGEGYENIDEAKAALLDDSNA